MRYFSLLKLPLILFIGLVSLTVAAQEPLSNVIASKKTRDGRYNYLKFDIAKAQFKSIKQPDDIKKMLGLGPRHSFVSDAIINNNRGFSATVSSDEHTRYKQYFNGVEVEYGVITLHSKGGALNVLTGEYFNIDENFSTSPALSNKTALDKAISFVGARKYSWQDSSISNPMLKSVPKGELVICRNYIQDAKVADAVPDMELAYKFAIYATDPLRYDYVYVSARTGEILLDNPIIKHINGTGATRYSGTKTLATTQIGGSVYVLKDSGGNYNVATYNLGRSSNYSTAAIFADNDNNWTAAEYNNSNLDNAALDAHWGAMMTQDYWRTVHNRNSFDNKGTKINSYIHYGNSYANAFWDGYEMTYGDGDGVTLGPLTSVDICGHEIGHAVCQYTANLIYSNESGAINEGFSDIWGACIKRFADASKNTWLMGDEISSTGTPVRSMSNPKSQGQPDTYKGINWYQGSGDNGGVHYNSGVMNHWFYILTEGKAGTNDKGFSYKVTGIGITKAAQIAYRAESLYLYPGAGYPDTRVAAIQAAEDLFGAGSNEVIQTTEAWNAVGVYDALAKPDSVTAAVTNNKVVVRWRFNTFQSIGGFKVQRAINGTNLYANIATVGPDVRSFTDTAYINNSLNQYRLISFRDSLYSDYSDVASVSVGNAPFIMANGTFTKCGVTFFDPGGQNYYGFGKYTTTVKPAIEGNKLRIDFSEFNLYNYDSLKVYNGPSSSSAILGSFSGSTLPPGLESSATGGELTYVFSSSGYGNAPGWKAYISCFRATNAPTNLVASTDSLRNVRLTWTDNASDEPGYLLERSVNDSVHFLPIVNLPANSTAYNDSSAPDNSYIYYRVRAFGDSTRSTYSNIAPAKKGNLYAMQNQVLTTCGITFLDPGGTGNIIAGNYTTTFRPATSGNKLKVAFSQFDIYYNFLYVYNGPSSSSPLLGSYSGSAMPPVFQSTAPGGELTFVLNAYYNTAPGWAAYISCYKPLNNPTNVTAARNNIKDVQVGWNDNASDETGYVVERSLNDSLHFVSLITLPANTSTYTDTSARDNSFIYYRIKVLRDTVSSVYSNTASVFNGNQYAMQNGSYSTCDVTFFDPGGTGNYSPGYYTTTIRPATAGNNLKITFSQFNIGYDNLYIYNGPSTSSPLLGSYSGTYLPPALKSTAPGGELTFVLNSYYSNNASGWAANVSCYKPVGKPSGVKGVVQSQQAVSITWTDNADDETKYVLERSVNASGLFKFLAELPSNTVRYSDSTAPVNSLLYYRIRAYRDTLPSLYSDTAAVSFGNAPFLIKDSTLTTCDKVFMDPGGADVISQNSPNSGYYNVRSTFKPGIAGNNVRVVFSNFKLNGSLSVYNGSSPNSPLIGTFSSYYNPPNISSLNFSGTGSEGSLTFVYQGYNYGDSGWVAQVSCYKPVAKASAVKTTISTDQKVVVIWNDNADDETKYVIERSVNASTLYTPVANLPSNSTQFIDSSAPANSLLYYRVKAYRDTLGSFYSDTAVLSFGNAPFLMKDSTLITCDKVFMDPGGEDVITVGSYSKTVTFKPAIAGNNIRVTFSKFRLYGSFNVYNGSSTSSPLIASYSYYSSTPGVINATNSEGALTFVYQGYSNPDSGWVAQVSCYKPVPKPSGLKVTLDEAKYVKLVWRDNADDETKYVVERSLNGISMFIPAGEAPANATQFVDSSAPANNFLYYRVRAYRDTLGSFYSDTASIAFGDVPFLMKDSTVVTCDKLFMDPGGADIIPGGYQTYYNIKSTFKPAISGNRIRVTFSKFKLQGNLYVYNGSSTSSPLIGTYSYYNQAPRVLDATESEGSLTFVYQGYGQNDSGWVAQVSCYKPVAKPTGVIAILDGSNQTRLTWTDNADDETKYVVEKSINAPSLYSAVAVLPAGATNFTDSSAPNNSLIFYRVRAYRDTLGSNYSDTATVSVGNAPFIMADSTLITCDKVFMDPGGIAATQMGKYYYTTATFKPGISGSSVRVAFSLLRISGNLNVYNGSSTSSPLIGSFSGIYKSALVFQGTGAEGSLTFQYGGYGDKDTGWLAQVTCYKPVAKPSGLKAIQNETQRIVLTWTDNADDETKYVVERSVNGISLFAPIGQLAANTNQYTDSTRPANSKLYYRVKAYRDTLGSLYSNIDSVAFGNIPFLMKDSTVITCSKEFMDPGGADVIPPSLFSSYNIRSTFKPAVAENKLKVVFSKFRLGGTLYIYDGSSTSSPLLASISSYNAPNSTKTFKATGSDGSLTFVYQGWSYSDSGWVAQISCFKPVNSPGNLTVDTSNRNSPRLTWTDNANNETGYVVERSTTDSFHYAAILKLPANTTSYIDTAAPGNSFMYYRVAAYIDTSNSDYSNPVSVVTGTPFIMQNTTITTCGIVFLDPGGLGNYNAGSYTATLKPATAGNVVRVQFSEFSIDGTLTVYNGATTSSPYIASYYGTSLPPLLQSTAPGGELTFVFNPSYSNYYPGWIGYISCYKPVLKPSDIKATPDNTGRINITWKDNADDETKYVVERSVNAPSLYKPICELESNSSVYIDSAAPINSLIYYRVRAYRDTAGSNYSDVAVMTNGNAPFVMKDTTLTTCDKIFMDPGGVDKVPSNMSSAPRTTFKPAVEGNKISVAFSKIQLEGYMYVYNGSSQNSPQLAFLNRYSDPSSVFNSTAPDGSLTFVYSGYSSNDSGWLAQVSCYKPVAKPSGMIAVAETSQKIKLSWTDNADDETRYVVERSSNSPSLYLPVAQLSANATQYIDTLAPANSLLFYRVKAYRDTIGSFYSDTATAAFGNAPFLMKDSTVITCDKVFMDAAGTGIMAASSNYNSRTTFKPATAGNNIQVTFSKLRINGTLNVFNGSSANSPQIGYLSSSSNPSSVFNSTAPDGSLTFSYSSSSYYNDSGWVAQVSCYKPVAKPSGVKAIADSSQQMMVTWNDNADDETRYVLERSNNAPGQFKVLAQLPSNANQYRDSTAPPNSLLYYRVKAYRDTLSSFYSDTAAVAFGNAPFLMKDSTVVTCEKIFMDQGGVDAISSSIYTTRTTFKPGIAGNKLKVAFRNLSLKYGYLSIYNGSSSNSPLLGTVGNYYSNTNPASVFLATGPEGSLTFVYQNQSSYSVDSGWVALVSCYKLPEKPSGVKATADSTQIVGLTWSDNANDETKYFIERSLNSPSQFKPLAQLPPNTTRYADSSAPANSLLYYRVRAYRDIDSLSSLYSDTASVSIGNAPFLMKDSILITCDKVFMDAGGVDVIPAGSYYNTISTFKPGVSGNNIKVAFSKMSLNGSLSVFDGSSTNSPLIGRMGYNYPGAPLVYSATGPEGSLTFAYQGSGYSDSGWVARINCFKSVAAPSNLTARADNLKNVNLSWTDNADDETSYYIERSFEDSLHFLPLKSLPANSTTYIDTALPLNSYVFYRLRSYRDSVASGFSNNASVLNGTIFTMRSGKVTGCGITFLDPGGDANYPNNSNYTTTFTSPEIGKKIRVTFEQFNTESCCDYLNVYNGPDASYPLLGTYLGSDLPPVLQSSAPNGELTFVFTSDRTGTGTGWKAAISCTNANDTLNICSTDGNEVNTIQSDISGVSYQWQQYNGTRFVNVVNDINHSGTNTSVLHLKNTGLTVTEKFRCVVGSLLSREFVVVKANRWTGRVSNDWNDATNWSCGTVPDSNTDVLIEGGIAKYPVLNTNAECRSIKLLQGSSLKISSGYKLNIMR